MPEDGALLGSQTCAPRFLARFAQTQTLCATRAAGFYVLYTYMFRQRRKLLGGAPKSKNV